MLFPLYDRNPHHRFPLMTLLIIGVNVALMFWLSQLSAPEEVDALYNYGFIPKRVSQIENGQPLVISIDLPEEERRANPQLVNQEIELPADSTAIYLTFLSTMFLHGGWIHLATNMWMLWVFGNNIEDRLGHVTYVVYYLLGGLLATLTHWTIDPQSQLPLIGASGAVAAVLGGYAVTYPKAKVRTLILVVVVPLLFDLPALVVLGFWFILQLASGLGLIPGMVDQPVAFWAHIGGFVAGILLLPFLGLGAPPPDIDWKTEADDQFRFEDPRIQENE